jgi:hypothetical protein
MLQQAGRKLYVLRPGISSSVTSSVQVMECEDASGEDEFVRQAWLIVRPACGLSFCSFLLLRLPGRWSYFTMRVLTATQDPCQIKAHRA